MTQRLSASAGWRVPVALLLVALLGQRAPAQAIVRGEVFDSLLTNAPLEGATVVVQGTTVTATSDKRGRFVIRDLPAGRHVIGFFHPLLDSLQAGAPRQVIDVGARGTVRVTLSTPSSRTVTVALCGHEPLPATAVVFGFARAVEDEAPLEGAEASVRWFEFEFGGTGPRHVERRVTARTSVDGLYVLCDVPNDIAVAMVVVHGGQASGALHLGLDAAGIARPGRSSSRAHRGARWLGDSVVPDSVASARVAGSARIRAVVRNPQGRPVRDAIVGMRGTGVSGTTNDSGVVILSAVPAGSQTLAARAIGLAPALQVVTLMPGAEREVVVSMERPPSLLSSMSIIGQKPNQLDAEIKARSLSGWGVLVEGPALRNAAAGLSFWAGIPGMSIGRASSGSDAMPAMKGGINASCIPDVWMDGNRMRSIDGWEFRALLVNARRMEVFTRPSRVPPQYMTTSECGAILVWSR